MILFVLIAITIVVITVAIISIIKIKKHKSPPVTPPSGGDSQQYLDALASLSTSIRGSIQSSWNDFLQTASDRTSLIDPRDTFESFPQYFPSDVGMAPDTLSGKKITDPYELLLFYVNGIYKDIGDYSDDATPANEKVCVNILQNALTAFGAESQPDTVTCGANKNYILSGSAKLEGTSMTWNDYFNAINTSTKNNYQHSKVKYQYWIKGISPLSTLNDLDNMALLIISQCTSSLSIFNDLLKLAVGGNLLTGNVKSDTANVDTFHELRKVLRSLIRTFTEFCECSPLTFYKNCADKNSAAGVLTCTNVQCCEKSAASIPIAACMKNLTGHNFKEIMAITDNPKVVALTAIALLGEKTDCNYDKNCNSACDSKSCTNVSTPVSQCGFTDCDSAAGCNIINCDLVSWFGNVHDNMVQYLPALSAGVSNIGQLRDWINQDVTNVLAYLKLNLAKYLYYTMFSSWKESFARACQSAPGQKMLRGPSNYKSDGWLCWNDSLAALNIKDYKVSDCSYVQ